jgi:hypothetical protein
VPIKGIDEKAAVYEALIVVVDPVWAVSMIPSSPERSGKHRWAQLSEGDLKYYVRTDRILAHQLP